MQEIGELIKTEMARLRRQSLGARIALWIATATFFVYVWFNKDSRLEFHLQIGVLLALVVGFNAQATAMKESMRVLEILGMFLATSKRNASLPAGVNFPPTGHPDDR